MPATASLVGIEIAGAGVEGTGVGVNGVEGFGGGRHRRSPSNRRRRIPIEITNQAAFNDYISSLVFTASDDYSPEHFHSPVRSWGIYSYNHTPSVPISEEVDLESGELEAKVHSSENDEKQCRICHLKFAGGDNYEDDDHDDEDNGEAMELGCDCKGDLATAHKNCALTWFLIKGDLNCEICGSIVQNVGTLTQNVDLGPIEEANNDTEVHQPPESSVVEHPFSEPENGSFMHGRRCGVRFNMVRCEDETVTSSFDTFLF
ncbi:hypothetical protein L1887_22669 [Cichorium endivia]|nr:hypothetical protein L1887_22669 [Cichorium endivia]